MKLTASDARLRLCHRTLMNDTFETCEGPRCMAWRWDKAPANQYRIDVNIMATEEPPRPPTVPDSWIFIAADPHERLPAKWLEPDEEVNERRSGWCGLAGRPDYD